jgi:membrane glycosyltransferase
VRTAATKQYLQLNHLLALTNGLMRAAVNQSFNELSTSLATAHHHLRAEIKHNREKLVNKALGSGAGKLVKDRHLELFSNPVALSRLHQLSS